MVDRVEGEDLEEEREEARFRFPMVISAVQMRLRVRMSEFVDRRNARGIRTKCEVKFKHEERISTGLTQNFAHILAFLSPLQTSSAEVM